MRSAARRGSLVSRATAGGFPTGSREHRFYTALVQAWDDAGVHATARHEPSVFGHTLDFLAFYDAVQAVRVSVVALELRAPDAAIHCPCVLT